MKIGEMLEHNKSLLSLSLSSNQAIYQVWNSIAVGLAKNCTLMRLDLTLCDINLQAAERIHEALGINNVCDINLDLQSPTGRTPPEPPGLYKARPWWWCVVYSRECARASAFCGTAMENRATPTNP